MDANFKYSEEGKLRARNSYYSAKGMLYQIVTRVVDELKIVVLNNPELYAKLLSIKAMGFWFGKIVVKNYNEKFMSR